MTLPHTIPAKNKLLNSGNFGASRKSRPKNGEFISSQYVDETLQSSTLDHHVIVPWVPNPKKSSPRKNKHQPQQLFHKQWRSSYLGNIRLSSGWIIGCRWHMYYFKVRIYHLTDNMC